MKNSPARNKAGNSASKQRSQIYIEPSSDILLLLDKEDKLEQINVSENEYWGNSSAVAINFCEPNEPGKNQVIAESSRKMGDSKSFVILDDDYQRDYNAQKVNPKGNAIMQQSSDEISQHLIEQGSSEQGAPLDIQQVEMAFTDHFENEELEPKIKQSKSTVQNKGPPTLIRVEDLSNFNSSQGNLTPVEQLVSNFNLLMANQHMLQHQNSIGSQSDAYQRSTVSSGQYEAPIPRNFKFNQGLNELKLLKELNGENKLNLMTIPELSRGESFEQTTIPYNFQLILLEQLNQQRKEDLTLPPSERTEVYQNHHMNEQQQSSSSSSEEAKNSQLQRILSAEQNPRRFDSQVTANIDMRYPSQNYQMKQRAFTKIGHDQQSNIFHFNNQVAQIDEGLVDVDELVFDNFQDQERAHLDEQSQNPKSGGAMMTPVKQPNPTAFESLSLQMQPSLSPYQRFNKQFFEDLKTQQIGFATILKDRRASHLSHSTLIKGIQEQSKTNFDQLVDQQIRDISIVQQQKQQLLDYVQNPNKGIIQYNDGWIKKKKNQNFLLDLQTRIEFNNQMKNNIERAIILFNEKPKKGIDFLIKNQLLEYDPDTISEFLLTTPGLSKFAIGQYIGNTDDFNVAVMRAFCNKVDFRGMEIDDALRLFLSQFRLPGESQQIDRIIEQFSMIFLGDNPSDFEEPTGSGGLDGVYVLAFSLIFLNTLNHNPKVPQQRKLTKDQFINQNLYVNPKFPVKKLEDMFARIMANEFKTDTQYVEKIYERIRAFNHEEKPTRDTIKRSANVLQAGEHFLKFGRIGKPHMRFVKVSDEEDMIYWYQISKEDQEKMQEIKSKKKQGEGTINDEITGKEQLRFIKCEDIIDIKVGYNASNVLKRHKLPIEFDDLIFSIQTKTRTLDLQAKTSEIRNRWVKFLKLIHNEKEQKQKIKQMETEIYNKERRQRIRFDLEEIWEQDVMTNFSAHWDYKNHWPKSALSAGLTTSLHTRRSSEGLNKRSVSQNLICKLSSCAKFFKKRRSQNQRQSISGMDKSEFSPQAIDLDSDQDSANNYLGTINMKGFLLEQLWRKGIPPKFRQKLWPFVIQNKLELSKKLYQINLAEGLLTLKRINKTQRGLKGMNKLIIEKMEQDIRQTLLQNERHKAQRQSEIHTQKIGKYKTLPTNNHLGMINEEEELKDNLFEVAQNDNQDFQNNNELHSGQKLNQGIISTMRNVQEEEENHTMNQGSPTSPVAYHNRTSTLVVQDGFQNSEYDLSNERLLNLIVAFVNYRPDIAYLPKMSFLAGMFLKYCNDYDAYVSFSNFIHNHYFFDLFRGNVSDIKLRIDKFNKYFKVLLPELFKHFETLDVTTDLFLIDWLLTLYLQHLNMDIVARIWDNFMLDGEVFAIKVGLAILISLEKQLQNQSYFTIINCLRGESQSDDRLLLSIDEEQFFATIDSLQVIDTNDYYDDLKMQKWSYQKSKILGGVFK